MIARGDVKRVTQSDPKNPIDRPTILSKRSLLDSVVLSSIFSMYRDLCKQQNPHKRMLIETMGVMCFTLLHKETTMITDRQKANIPANLVHPVQIE